MSTPHSQTHGEMSECQKKFEAWYSNNHKECLSLEKKYGGYRMVQASFSWTVWQAAWEKRNADLAESRGSFTDQAQLLEVLSFIEKCRSLKIETGLGDLGNTRAERLTLQLDADALYRKLEAKRWGALPLPQSERNADE